MMSTTMTVTAVSADIELLEQPLSRLAGRVHSVFRSVINVEPASGDLWCIATADLAPGPRTIVVDAASFDRIPLGPGMPVTVIGADVKIGALALLRLAGAKSWQVPVITGQPTAKRVRALESALAGLAVTDTSPLGQAITARVATALAALSEAVRHANSADAMAAAASIIGLGVGLTPTGDDVLTGCAYAAAHLGGTLAMIPSAVAHVVAPQATNAISLVALHQACRGRAHQRLADVLVAVCGAGGVGGIGDAVRRLTAIGHTSGTDQAIGLLTAVRLHSELHGPLRRRAVG